MATCAVCDCISTETLWKVRWYDIAPVAHITDLNLVCITMSTFVESVQSHFSFFLFTFWSEVLLIRKESVCVMLFELFELVPQMFWSEPIFLLGIVRHVLPFYILWKTFTCCPCVTRTHTNLIVNFAIVSCSLISFINISWTSWTNSAILMKSGHENRFYITTYSHQWLAAYFKLKTQRRCSLSRSWLFWVAVVGG